MYSTRTEATQTATANEPAARWVACIRMAKGYTAVAFTSRAQAVNWVDFNRGWFHPGSDTVTKVTD